jgi:hypothetical protein
VSLNSGFVSATALFWPDLVRALTGLPRSCWRQSRRTLECLWAPYPWYVGRQKQFVLSVSCRAAGLGQESRMVIELHLRHTAFSCASIKGMTVSSRYLGTLYSL